MLALLAKVSALLREVGRRVGVSFLFFFLWVKANKLCQVLKQNSKEMLHGCYVSWSVLSAAWKRELQLSADGKTCARTRALGPLVKARAEQRSGSCFQNRRQTCSHRWCRCPLPYRPLTAAPEAGKVDSSLRHAGLARLSYSPATISAPCFTLCFTCSFALWRLPPHPLLIIFQLSERAGTVWWLWTEVLDAFQRQEHT